MAAADHKAAVQTAIAAHDKSVGDLKTLALQACDLYIGDEAQVDAWRPVVEEAKALRQQVKDLQAQVAALQALTAEGQLKAAQGKAAAAKAAADAAQAEVDRLAKAK